MTQTQRGQLKRDDSNTPVGWSYVNISSAATTVVKTGAGVLHAVVINKPVTSSSIVIYDNTGLSGTKIGTITLPATLLTDGPLPAIYDAAFSNGLTVQTNTAADITITFI